MRFGEWQDFIASFLFTLGIASSGPCDDGLAPTHHDPWIREVSVAYRIPHCWAKAQLVTENTHLDPHISSHAGAVGCAQFMPKTWVWLEKRYNVNLDIRNCRDSIYMYARRIRELVDYYTGKDADDPWAFAAASYNAGEGRVNKTVKSIGRGFVWAAIQDALPSETIRYVAKILLQQRRLRR